MASNGFFRVCQNGEGFNFARLTWNKSAFMRTKFISLLYKTNRFHVAVHLSSKDQRRRQNEVRTSVKNSAIASCATFLFLPHFDVICDLLLGRCTEKWNLFVKYTIWPISQKHVCYFNADFNTVFINPDKYTFLFTIRISCFCLLKFGLEYICQSLLIFLVKSWSNKSQLITNYQTHLQCNSISFTTS